MTTGTENAATGQPVREPGAPQARDVGGRDSGLGRRAGTWSLLRRHPWPVVCAALVVFSYFLVRWARTSPGFDPYGWLVWGYQTLRLNLNLGGAPSWKPVTFIFTVPYSLFGHLSYWLWMVTAVSIALGGPIVAGRIVYRLVRQNTAQFPAIVGAVFAGLCLLGIVQYTHYWLSAQSDPMLVTFFLLAIDMHLLRRHRWAFTFLWLCSLGRPEAWPFLGLYFLWAWRTVPRMRLLMVIELVLIPALWFGVPVLSGNPWDVAGKLAERSPRMLHSNKVVGTFTRFRELSYWPVEVLAGIGVVIAALRRDWRVLAIAACSVAWLIIEIGFALHGFPGVPRYMFEGAGAFIVVSGIGLGWLLGGLGGWITRVRHRTGESRVGLGASATALAGAALAVAMVVLMVPRAVTAERTEHADLIHERARTAEIHRLDAALSAFGGYHFIRSCGDPASDVEWVSILAWYTKLDVGYVGHRPQYIINVEKNKPSILFTALGNGWIVHTYHLRPSAPASCRKLNRAYYIVTPRHPGGYVGHQA